MKLDLKLRNSLGDEDYVAQGAEVNEMKRFLEILTNVRIATGEIGGTVCLIFLVAFGMYEAWHSFIWPLLK